MTDRKTASTINDEELDQLYGRAARAEAALRQVLGLLHPVKVCGQIAFYQATEHPIAPDDYDRWRAALDEPAPTAATQTAEPREHCGDLKPPFSETTERTECVLRPGHQGSHADQHGTRWWWTDNNTKEQPDA